MQRAINDSRIFGDRFGGKRSRFVTIQPVIQQNTVDSSPSSIQQPEDDKATDWARMCLQGHEIFSF